MLRAVLGASLVVFTSCAASGQSAARGAAACHIRFLWRRDLRIGCRKGRAQLHAGKPDGESTMDIAGGAMVFRNYSMSKQADYLSARAADHPVMDATELSGPFDFTVQLADRSIREPGGCETRAGNAMRDGTRAKLVAERLGLRLESRKGPVAILVIDHAEKASEN